MAMKRVTVNAALSSSIPQGRINEHLFDSTSAMDIKRHQKEDDNQAMKDTALFARRVRKRLGLTQVEFSRQIEVPIDTIRNWEQGKRRPTGPAKALLKLLSNMPIEGTPFTFTD